MLTSKADLKQLVRTRKLVREQAETSYEDPEDFIFFCYIAKNPQSYGSLLEKRIREKNGMIKVEASQEKGDAVDVDGNFKEIKCSISDCGVFNAVQIRPHHNIHSCLLFFFEIDDSTNVVNHFFEVPEKDVLTFPGISIAHGVKANKNSKSEYRITFDKNKKKSDTVAGRAWNELQKYKISNKIF
jgi:hypothetical protein